MAKVLIPLDGSDRSMQALETGLRLLGASSEVTLLGVQNSGFRGAGEDRIEEFDDDEEDEIFPTEDSVRRMLGRAKEACAELGVEAQTKVREGRPVVEILAEAVEHDVLVMHALDRSGVKEKIRMSSTEKLARKAACHVLLVADGKDAA